MKCITIYILNVTLIFELAFLNEYILTQCSPIGYLSTVMCILLQTVCRVCGFCRSSDHLSLKSQEFIIHHRLDLNIATPFCISRYFSTLLYFFHVILFLYYIFFALSSFLYFFRIILLYFFASSSFLYFFTLSSFYRVIFFDFFTLHFYLFLNKHELLYT
jgi:hypothetical protein